MNNIDKATADRINDELKRYFRSHGMTYVEVAGRLGYSCRHIINNQLSKGRFGKHMAEKWAREFGFRTEFLLTGKGRLVERKNGYQKLVRENESHRNVIGSQMATIRRLTSENEELKRLVRSLKGEAVEGETATK